MIQEIAPHCFRNEFYVKTPSADSYFLYFQDGTILLNHSSSLKIPKFSELSDFNIVSDHLDYLFSIDSKEYYLIDETSIMLSENKTLALYPTSVIRDLDPLWTAFAAANAAQLHRFYQNNRFCGRCGTETRKSKKERAIVCPSCGNTIYPKIAPAVIVAVTNGDKLLLTKYAGREYTRYALVAGYTEFGETLEETVRREVMEEVGLKVKNIRYYKNQPWAFSDSMLVGFFAELDGSPQIYLDESELSTAVWLKREDIPGDYTNVSLTHEMILLFKNGQTY
ncbi:NAD(+) diphosphatase [Hungatella effluvii]|uniref:NAD(+) diphosphatase n=1 Tax=Hungatella effluvii TaxID=1096246 RepID=UPI0022E84472|nr:NAD(+) diphosphatase [Hungatella effluvii]